MTSPYQYSVVGAIQDISLADLPPNPILYVTDVPNWASYRWSIQPLYGTVTDSLTYIPEADSYAASGAQGAYDTGWLQYNAAGYSSGDILPESAVYSEAWYTSRSLPVPKTVVGPVLGLPAAVPLGRGCTGIRVTSFVYFGGFDADTQNISFQTGDASGLSLTPLSPGYYLDHPSNKVYRDPAAPPYPLSQVAIGTEPLSNVVSRVCLRGGLSAADFDVTALTGIAVLGYPIARQANAADAILPLMQAYFGYGSEYDAKLRFKFYGDDADVTIDAQDLLESGSEEGAIKSNLRNQETEFPRRVVASYMDPAQNYSVVNVAAERLSIDVTAIGDQAFQIPVVMDADTAARAADRAMKVAYASLQGKLEFSTPFAGADSYISLAAGEPALLNGKRYVVDEMILGNGVIKFTQRYDRQSAYTSNVQATVGNAPSTPPSPYSGPTTLVPMNLPSLRPQDTYGVYLAAGASYADSQDWTGCTVQVSYDGQQSWVNGATIASPSVFGRLTLAEPVGGEPLTAQMNGQLESVTDAQILARANAFALLHASSTEIGQFKTATETATDNEYELTDVTRGGLGTTRVAGITGGQIVMLEDVTFLPIDLSFAGKTIYFRAVGFNEQAEDAVVVPFVYTPDLTVVINGGEVT